MNINLNEGSTLQDGKYKIIRMLGKGGFGITYLARHSLFDKTFAIKEFFPQDYCNRESDTSHVSVATASNHDLVDRLRTRFISEARNIAELKHTNIIGIHDIFEENGTAYFVMDFIEGESLDDMVKRCGFLTENKAVGYIRKIAEALAYVHDRKMTHYDIKPANIMVRRSDDEPILIDFGLSKQYTEAGRQKSTFLVGLSHGYSPLEQYSEDTISTFSPQSDVYSLGATLYTLLTGRIPPDAPKLAGNAIELPENIKPELKQAVRWAMATQVSQRCPSAKTFINILDKAVQAPIAVTDSGTVIANGSQHKQNHQAPYYVQPPQMAQRQNINPAANSGYSQSPQQDYAPHSQKVEKKSSGIPSWSIITIAVVIIGILICALIVTGNKEPAKPVDTLEQTETSTAGNSGLQDGLNTFSGQFMYNGVEYGFRLTLNYDSSTGTVSDAIYEPTDYYGPTKLTDASFSGNTLCVSDKSTNINAFAAPGSNVFEGTMIKGKHAGTCRLVLQ